MSVSADASPWNRWIHYLSFYLLQRIVWTRADSVGRALVIRNADSLRTTIAPVDAWLGEHFANLVLEVSAWADLAWVVYKSAHLAYFLTVFTFSRTCNVDYRSQKSWWNTWHWHFLKRRVANCSSCTTWAYSSHNCDRIDHDSAGFLLQFRLYEAWKLRRISTRSWQVLFFNARL